MRYNIIFVLFLSIIILSSCSKILSIILGVKDVCYETVDEQIMYLKKYDIDTSFLFYLKPEYIDSLEITTYCLDSFNKFSPVQFRIYDNNGIFLGGWEQCFGNPKIIGFFDSIPPITKRGRLPINYNLSFQKDSLFLQKIMTDIPNIKNYDYVIMGFWAKYLGSLSKKMLVNLQAYINDHPNKKFLFIKVNLGTLYNVPEINN